MNKSELRNKIKAICERLSAEYKASASEAICEKVISSDSFNKSKTVFIYFSTANEPDTHRIISEAWAQGKTVCVPLCGENHTMKSIQLQNFNELTAGRYGIPEPTGTQEVNAADIDLAIIPCVCASPDGKRLGHGAGYYDRFLEHTKSKKVCLCFGRLLTKDIQMDKYDIYMDNVISE